METQFVNFEVLFELRFKSYYVVWKQHSTKWHLDGGIVFKSYYVVWKLDPPDDAEKKEEYV